MTGACHAPVDGRQGKMVSSQFGDLATPPHPSQLPSPLKIRRLEAVSLREMFAVSLRQWAVNVLKNRQRPCRVLQNLNRLQTWHKASAEAAYPLGERNALLMRSVKSAFALLLTKVTKPAAERRKTSFYKIPQIWR